MTEGPNDIPSSGPQSPRCAVWGRIGADREREVVKIARVAAGRARRQRCSRRYLYLVGALWRSEPAWRRPGGEA